MQIKKNIKPGKVNYLIFFLILFLSLFLILNSNSKNINEGNYTDIKVLDKISSKNILVRLKNGEFKKYKDLMIKSMKCKNSEFDDNPEIIAYLQVKDLKNIGNDEVFVFNGWTFSSSPSINTFDHPVYDLWLIRCFN